MADVGVQKDSGGEPKTVLMTLDGARQDPDAPLLHADDQAALRGDGVFETILVRGGLARKLPAHLERLARSAAILELPAPDLDVWAKAATAAARAWGGAQEGVLRLVLSRGRESVLGSTAYLSVSALPERTRRVRESGVAAVTLERGYSTELAASSPWLPLGAKTLSYAVNMAAVRHAERLGADDVIFVSAEGNVLEGPRSTVVIARGRQLLTPPPEQGILAGTTQRALFQEAERRGLGCAYGPLRPADLIAADGVWMLSSIALAITVHTVNGLALATPTLDEQIKSMVATAI
ncbi:aminodeoxychorismate lyase [Tomitella biformata]|uniref:aminodeoxychorismate lyase n=1 Tax=Tomitella biformata TaxID=630403 RepID=UPI000684EA79|nr:aminodeoxychorismate lyase [Tomitella biformata]